MSTSYEPASDDQLRIPAELPVLPLRDMVVYPFIIAPLSVARDLSIQAVDHALSDKGMGVQMPSLPQPGAITRAVSSGCCQ